MAPNSTNPSAYFSGELHVVIIISEPPPSFSWEHLDQVLQALFGDRLLQISRFHWPTGVDGWLEDVVIRVRPSGDETELVMSGPDFESAASAIPPLRQG
jgi:hypothetical protein